MNTRAILRHPTASLPLVLSLVAVGLVIGHVARFGIVHHEDEGTAAPIFQLLLVMQLPIMALFAFRWLPRAPRPALRVVAMQVNEAFAALALVYSLEM